MNGNSLNFGQPTPALNQHTQTETGIESLTDSQRKSFKRELREIVDIAGKHLPEIYTIDCTINQSPTGPEGFISVHQPSGSMIGTNITPMSPEATDSAAFIDDESQREIAINLVATSVIASMQETGGDALRIAN